MGALGVGAAFGSRAPPPATECAQCFLRVHPDIDLYSIVWVGFLDRVPAAVLGVMFPWIIADITLDMVRFNSCARAPSGKRDGG